VTASARRVRERLDVKVPDASLALRQLRVRCELAVALTCYPVVFRAEALLKPAAAHDRHPAGHEGCDHDDRHDDDHDDPG